MLKSLPVAAALRVLAVAAAVALVAVAAGPSGFWVCVPAALLLAARARGVVCLTASIAIPLAAATPAALHSGPRLPVIGLAIVASSVGVLQRVRTRLERERDSMRRSALRDPLTGAWNRRGLDERIAYEIARHSRECRRFAVFAIDLDGFKRVNDRFGHAAGDELLRDVAVALTAAVRRQDTVARLGGDEFCVLAPETEHAGAQHLAGKLEAAIARVAVGVDALSGSVGVAVYPEDGRDASTVLQAADTAQIAAKRRVRAAPESSLRAA
jgi:diguanylate cyclase (GGDEF)-like protein